MDKNNLISETSSIFNDNFSVNPEIISLAPGRINIIGEHTDYNLGLAMPAAINRWICIAISIRKKSSPERIPNDEISRFLPPSFHAFLQQSSEQPVWGYPPSWAVPSTMIIDESFE